MIVLLLTIFFIWFTTSIICTLLIRIKDYSEMSKIYKNLKIEDFQARVLLVRNKDCSIVWYLENNSFCINDKKRIYIHNDKFLFLFLPLDYYWWLKYKNWFQTNCSELIKE